jgi:hypothetical protein
MLSIVRFSWQQQKHPKDARRVAAGRWRKSAELLRFGDRGGAVVENATRRHRIVLSGHDALADAPRSGGRYLCSQEHRKKVGLEWNFYVRSLCWLY